MIKDIKLGIKMMKYGLNYHGVLVAVVLAIGAGVLFTLLVPIGIMASIWVGMGVMAIVQLIYSESVSTMVQSSPYKKKLRTTIPTWIATITMLMANTLCIILQEFCYFMVKDNKNEFLAIVYEQGEYETYFLISSLILVFMLLYIVFCNKFFWAGIILAFSMWVEILAVRFHIVQIEILYLDISAGTAIFLSYLIVLLGCAILHILNCLTYKREYSNMTYKSLLKRASQ